MAGYPTGVTTQATVVWGGDGTTGVDVPVGATGTAVMAAGTQAAGRTALGLGSAATASASSFAAVANNLSDLANAATARTNLGLGTAATQAATSFAQTANDLSDLASTLTARQNLGLNQKRRVRIFDTFFNAFVGCHLPWVTTVGTNTSVTAPSASEVGIIRNAVGTSASADQRAGMTTTAMSFKPGAIRTGLGFRGATANVQPDGTNLTTIRHGFYGNGTAGDPTNGIYFRSTNGGNWLAVCRVSSVETATDTGIALAALGTFQETYLEINAAGTSVRFFIGQTLVATVTTNIPGNTVGLFPYATIQRTQAAAVNNAYDYDWAALLLEYPANILPYFED